MSEAARTAADRRQNRDLIAFRKGRSRLGKPLIQRQNQAF